MCKIFRNELYGAAFGARSFENLPVGLVILIIKTTLMVLRCQHSSLLVACFVIFFTIWRFSQGKHGFLHGLLVFPPSFAEEKADEEPRGLLQFCGIERVKLGELFFVVQLFNNFLCQRLFMSRWSYVASFAERFQVVAECFVNGLLSGGPLRCRSSAARIAVRDFLL